MKQISGQQSEPPKKVAIQQIALGQNTQQPTHVPADETLGQALRLPLARLGSSEPTQRELR